MARLPSEQYLMQQIGGEVILFEDYTEREIVRFDPSDTSATASALGVIRDSGLGDEDKSFAPFWAGYFASYAGHPGPEPGSPVTFDEAICRVGVFGENNHAPIADFDPRDANTAAQAQKKVYDSALSPEKKSLAHFWCGFFYGHCAAK